MREGQVRPKKKANTRERCDGLALSFSTCDLRRGRAGGRGKMSTEKESLTPPPPPLLPPLPPPPPCPLPRTPRPSVHAVKCPDITSRERRRRTKGEGERWIIFSPPSLPPFVVFAINTYSTEIVVLPTRYLSERMSFNTPCVCVCVLYLLTT